MMLNRHDQIVLGQTIWIPEYQWILDKYTVTTVPHEERDCWLGHQVVKIAVIGEEFCYTHRGGIRFRVWARDEHNNKWHTVPGVRLNREPRYWLDTRLWKMEKPPGGGYSPYAQDVPSLLRGYDVALPPTITDVKEQLDYVVKKKWEGRENGHQSR